VADRAVFTWRSGGKRDLRLGAGYGLLNALRYAEERAIADSVVRGGHRSFLIGAHLGGPLGMTEHAKTPRGKATVGGNLRRSWYSSVSVDGSLIPGSKTIVGGLPAPNPQARAGIAGYFGNTAEYSFWVDQGTSKMPARPMAMPAVGAMTSAFGGLFRAGAFGYWNSRPSH
jgi:hypothetical protein